MSSIVYHKVGIDNQNPELGRALEHADDCVRAAARSYSLSKYDIPKAQVDLQIALLNASLQPAKRNVALIKDRHDVILEALLLSTNTPTA